METAPKSWSTYSTTSSAPAAVAGHTCGKVTVRKVRHAPLPRERDTSSVAESVARSAAMVGSTT